MVVEIFHFLSTSCYIAANKFVTLILLSESVPCRLWQVIARQRYRSVISRWSSSQSITEKWISCWIGSLPVDTAEHLCRNLPPFPNSYKAKELSCLISLATRKQISNQFSILPLTEIQLRINFIVRERWMYNFVNLISYVLKVELFNKAKFLERIEGLLFGFQVSCDPRCRAIANMNEFKVRAEEISV